MLRPFPLIDAAGATREGSTGGIFTTVVSQADGPVSILDRVALGSR